MFSTHMAVDDLGGQLRRRLCQTLVVCSLLHLTLHDPMLPDELQAVDYSPVCRGLQANILSNSFHVEACMAAIYWSVS